MKHEEIVRIKSIEIHNIKNVESGKILLNITDEESFGSSISGIYGQNGSGKTALIWAVGLLKNFLSGEQLPKDAFYYILQNKKEAFIKVEFLITLDKREYTIYYDFGITKTENNNARIYNEKLSYSSLAYEGLKKINKTTIFDIEDLDNDVVFNKCLYGPEIRIKKLSVKDKQIRQNLMIIQALSKKSNKSFIFANEFVDMLKVSFSNEIFFKIIVSLIYFGRINFFVLNKNSNTSFSMNILPLSARLCSSHQVMKCDSIIISLQKNRTNELGYEIVVKTIGQINLLVSSLIPNLKIDVVMLDTQLSPKGEKQINYELASNRKGVITPLRYESEGIKKILCILSSLIAMFNDESIFVAIDELDSGIFEYLLGEFLSVIKEYGKGQLLFTSHNMRPLEVLDNSNIFFTTTNPKNKYIQFKGIKNHHNLRDTLLRTIDLGGQKESVYENTSKYKIEKAFRKAGEISSGRE